MVSTMRVMITGLPSWLHCATSCFCTSATFSGGTCSPRLPLETINASADPAMSAKLSRAWVCSSLHISLVLCMPICGWCEQVELSTPTITHLVQKRARLLHVVPVACVADRHVIHVVPPSQVAQRSLVVRAHQRQLREDPPGLLPDNHQRAQAGQLHVVFGLAHHLGATQLRHLRMTVDGRVQTHTQEVVYTHNIDINRHLEVQGTAVRAGIEVATSHEAVTHRHELRQAAKVDRQAPRGGGCGGVGGEDDRRAAGDGDGGFRRAACVVAAAACVAGRFLGAEQQELAAEGVDHDGAGEAGQSARLVEVGEGGVVELQRAKLCVVLDGEVDSCAVP